MSGLSNFGGAGGAFAGSAGGAAAGAGGIYSNSAYSAAGGSVIIAGGNSQAAITGSLPAEHVSCMDYAAYYDVTQSWAMINEAGSSGRKVGDHNQLNYVDGDTSFRVEIMNDMQVSFFKELRGRFFTPFRVFVGHPTIDTDKKEIEIMMAYPEAIAKTEEAIRNAWVVSLNQKARHFFKVLYWDLWTWENAEPHYHDIYCSLDDVK
jgi:hypothetical protein